MTIRRANLISVVLVSLVAFVTGTITFALRDDHAAKHASYLAQSLGRPQPATSLVRPALGAKLQVAHGGLRIMSGTSSLSLAFPAAHGGTWHGYEHGVSRRTPFGSEAITFGVNRMEESLIVDSHQGTRVWRWRLSTKQLVPRVGHDGSVRFSTNGKPSGFRILPIAILDRHGNDITPAGARWSLTDHGNSLDLRLDDAKLPVPYVIDPIALDGTCGPGAGDFAGCSVHTVNQKTDFTSSPLLRPSSVSTGDLMIAQITLHNNDAITAPAGWTAIGNKRTSGANVEQALYYRIATAADTPTTTYSWSWSTLSDGDGAILAYSGVDSTSPFDVTPTDNAGTGTTATATGLTTTQNGDMLIAFYGVGANTTLAQNSGQGLTQEYTLVSQGGNKVRFTEADGTQASPGASGNKTAGVGSSQSWVAHLAALTPALSSDGSGTMGGSISNVSASQTGRTITFTYTAASGGMINGAVTLAVPSGWSAPSTTGSNAGYSTANAGTLSVAGQTITVSNLTLAGGATMTITYGSTAGGGPGATATSTTGAQTWQTQEKSRSTGTLTNLASSPSITVNAADGTGTLTTGASNVSASQTGRTITFTYTAATGGLSSGTVTLVVPSGWTAPSTTSNNAGYTTASTGTVSVASQTITVSSITLAGGSTLTVTYGDTSGGGTGATATSSTGAQTWQAQEKSTPAGSLANLASSPSITVNAADGTGTLTTGASNVSASQTGRTITFTYTAATGGLSSGAVTVVVPSGWIAPSTTSNNAGYTTASTGTVSVASQTITVSSITLAGGSTLTVTYGDTSGGGTGATATSSTGPQTWQAQEKSTSSGSLANLSSSPGITVYAADGSGTLTADTSVVSASQTGRTITFTYTAATGGLSNGSVTIDVPSGWSAPSTTGSNAGYTTASTGTLSVSGQTITVSSLTLAGGSTLTVTYGATGSGGPGATASSSTGAQTWQGQEQSTSGGSLTNLVSSPSITVYAADGSGTLASGTSYVSAGQMGRTITFTYTAATGGISNGSVTLDVPSGWSAPSTTGTAAGYTTASSGTLSVSGQTITVSSLTVAGGSTFTITYGDTGSGGPGATTTSTTGAQTWQAKEKSTSAGSLTNLASSPSITVNGADGTGTLTTPTSNVANGSTGNTITFTYTAATGGISSGSVTLDVPSGWSAPSTTGTAAGYTTASSGTVSVSGQTITVSSLTVAGGSTFTITYGATGGGGPGATASTTAGSATWQAKAKSTSGGSLTNLASSPSINVYAADGSGTLTLPATNVTASSTGNTLTFTYTAATGGMSNGSVTVAAPAGWSAPSTTATAAGYTTSSSGTVSVSGQTITVSSLTLAGGATFTITYGATSGGGPGATAGSSTGAQTFQAQQKSTSGGTLTSLAASPGVTVYAADGSGTLTTGTSNVSASQAGRTITFTYTAATGGSSNGSVTVAVPAGWTAPSTAAANAGYTTASAGTVSVSGQTITVSSLTLAGGNTVTITYGDTSGGGSGATATSSTGGQTWQAQEKSLSGGTLTNLASSPSITVYAADGSGTLTTGTTNVSASQTGRTIAFTYTAAAGGMSSGSFSLAVPAGWTAPSTTSSNAGYTSASTGTVSVSGQTITLSSLTLAGGATATITYGDTSGGGSGATVPSSTGAQTWQGQEKSTPAGSLTNLASSPSITVNAADGSGSLTTGTSNVANGSSGNTITFTYTAAAGGLSSGSVTIDVPAGWNAPSTTGSNAGYTTASTGSVSVSGQTITISNVTLAGGGTMTASYGSTASGGPGATAPSSGGSATWQAKEKSTSGGSLTNLSSSPSINVLAADGSGTLTTPTGSVNSASTGNTITFTYTAAAGGLSNGSITVAVPSGWSTPSTTGSNAGYTTASTGSVSTSGQTITVSSVTLAGGATMTITYGSTASGGPGAIAPVPAGSQTWTAQQKPSASGTLTNLAASPSITVNDTTAPSAPSLSFGSLTNASTTGTTVYIREGSAGGFTVTGTSSDAESGIDHLTFASGLGSGWTGGGADSSSPYSGVYTFGAGPTAPSGGQDVSATNGSGLTSSSTQFTVVADTTPPSVTAPIVTAGYYTTLSVPVTTAGGTDSGSGVDATTSIVQRDVANLANGACGSFSGSWSTITLAGGNDTGVTSGHCYEYRELLSDRVGNQGASAASNVAKVDTAAPANSLSLSAVSGGAFKSGTTVYYRGAAAGSFKLTNAVSDAGSGPASSTTATLGGTTAGWSHTPSTVSTPAGGPYDSNTFSWNAGASSSPTEVATAADAAGNTAAASTLTFTDDSTAPSVTAPSVTAGYSTSLSVPVTLNGGSDSGSGLLGGSSQVQRDVANLANGSCGSYSGSWTNITLSGGSDTGVTSGHCHIYREQLTDNVGNVGSSAASNVAKVDSQAPTSSLTLSSVTGNAYKVGNSVFYRGSAAGSFKLTNTVSDAESAPASSATAALGGTTTGWSHTPSTVSTPAGGPYDSNTFSWNAGASSSPTEVVTAADAAGNTASAPTLTFANDTSAPTTTIQCNGAACLNGTYYTASPVVVTLSADDGTGSGLQTIRYTTDGSDPSPVNGSDYLGALNVNTTTTIKFRAYDNLGNEEAVGSQQILLDGTPPTGPTLTLTQNPTSAGQYVSGTTLFYKPGGSGTFRVTAATSDAETGVTDVAFPAIANVTGGGSVASAPYRMDYTWGASTGDSGSHDVTATNGAGATSSAPFTLTPDSTAPTGQTITLTGASAPYYGGAVTFSLGDGNDGAGSGVDTSSRTVTRESASLNGDTCGTFSADPGTYSSPDSTVSDAHCYRYSFIVRDNVGNVSSAVTTTAKVDTAAPNVSVTAPTEVAGGANQYYDAGTKTQYFRAAGSGTFTLDATASDSTSGVTEVDFPDVSATSGWSGSTGGSDTSSPYTSPASYSWTSGASAPGSQNVTATDKAGNSGSDAIAIAADSSAPTGQTITLTGGSAPYFTSNSVTFTLGDGSDSGSGLDTSSRTVTRETGTLANGTCSGFTADGGTFSSPDTSVSSGHCYRYTFTIADNVGNASAPVQAVAKVDTDAPAVSVAAPTELTGAGNQYYDAASQTHWFRPSGSGSFSLSATASDGESGIDNLAFPNVSAVSGWSGSTGGTDTSAPYGSPSDYTWTSGATAPGARSITATNVAGTPASATFTIAADSTAPSGQAITLTGANAAYYKAPSVSFTLNDGSDSESGLDTSSRAVTRESATLNGDSCGTFSPDAGTYTSPDTSVAGGHCYRYAFTIADRVGNVSTGVSAVAKVDTVAPTATVTPSTELTGAGNQYYDAGTKTQFFRSTGSGSFRLNATASDADTAVAQVAFPDVSGTSGWSGSTGGADTSSPYSSPATYAWSSGAGEPGVQTVTASDAAGNDGTDTITLEDDTTAPSGQTIALTGAGAPYYSGASVAFALADGTDNGGGSGLDMASRTVTRETGTLANGNCSNFTADAGTFASPDTAVSNGHCYRYTFVESDNVGNQSAGAQVTAKVDSGAPTSTLTNPGTPLRGTVGLSANASDAESDVQQVVFQRSPAGAGTWTTIGTDTTGPYTASWDTTGVADGLYDLRVVTMDLAGNSAASAVVANREVDNTAPDTTIDAHPTDPSSATSPIFLFSSSETGSTFECRVDGGAWSSCSSPDPISPALGEGSHTFDVRAIDQAGNTDASAASYTWTIDTTAPDTSITAHPADPSSNTTPSFSFSSTESGSTFECRVDGGSWSPCTSPDTLSPALADGSHTFGVRATDQAANTDATPASFTWTVDTAAPDTSITAAPSNPSNSTTPAISFTSTEGGSTFECRIDGGSWSSCTSPDTLSPALAEGSHTFDVRATDQGGNTDATPASHAWTVDLTAPQTTIDVSPPDPDNDTAPSFQFSSSETGSTFECRIDGGSWSACTSTHSLSGLGDGSHTFDVRATDQSGNMDATPASYTWMVDSTVPNTSIDSGPSDPSNNSTPTFTFSADQNPATFDCRIDGSAWSACSSPDTLGSLLAGTHTFDVRAKNGAGTTDPSPASFTWTIDLTAPTVTITAPTTYINASDPTTYTVTASTPDGDVASVDFYECSNASAACSSGTWNLVATDTTAPYSGSWTTPAFDGPKAIRAVATDQAANTGADVRTITIDRTAPSGVTVSYPNGYVSSAATITTNNGPDADVNASTGQLERQTGNLANDSCSGFGAWSSASSPDAVASGHCAVYRYSVADNAGNVAVATSPNVVKSDTAAPTSAINDPGANLRQTITLSASASDTGGGGVASVAFQRKPSGGGSWTTIASDATAPYSVSFDTTTVSDGVYDFRSMATDAAGNVETSPPPVTNRRIDNTAPSAAMVSPGNPVHGSVTLTSNASDAGSGITTVSYDIAPHNGAFSSQTALWDTTGVIDGLYDLRVTATDGAGNSTTSAPITTRVDNTPPSLTFSSPASGAFVSGIVPLTASATDAAPASPPVTFEYKLHSDSSWTPTPASWNTTALPAGDGLYDVRATATDDAGNTASVVNPNVLVDSIPPSVTITAPPASINASFPSPTTFSATATDGGSGVASVEFLECSNTSVDCATGTFNSLGVDTTAPYSVSWNVPGDGNHALEAVATDNAGHPASTIENVNIDTTPPDTLVTGYPADPSNVPATFSFVSSETGSTFECRIDGGAWSACTSPHTFAGLSDGLQTAQVRATDPAGNTDPTPSTWSWHRDTTFPTGTLNNPGSNVRGVVTLTSAESDPTSNGYASGITSVSYEYSADGITWAPIGTLTSAPFDTINWNTVGIADGVYELRVVLTDVAGNVTGTAPVTNVRIDNTPPTTSQDDPGTYLRQTVTLTGSAADTGSGVDHVDFQIAPAGSGTWSTIGSDVSAPYSAPFDTTTVPDGHYDFRTVAVDVAGNQATSIPVTGRLVDNTPPTATMNDPSTAGGFVRGSINLTSVTDDPNGTDGSGVASVTYEYSTNSGSTWTNTGATLNTTSLPDGNLLLHVIVADHASNTTTSASVSDTIDNTKPVTTDDAPSGWQSSAVTVHLTATDAGSSVNVTEYSVDGGSYVVGTSVTIPAPADGSNDGAHTIAYFSADNVGNVEQVKSATVLIDASPPACPSCTAADYLRGTVTLSASPVDSGAGIKSVEFQYADHGSTSWTTIGTDATGPAPYTVDWTTTAVPDGQYDLQILVTDNADNTTVTTLADKVVDNTAPNVAVVGSPTQGAVVSGNVGITASAADVTSPIASVQFLVNGSPLTTDTTAPYSATWNSAGGPDGSATIEVVVTDMAGNSTTSAVRTITVDNRSPVPTLSDPGANLSGTVTLTATSDPDTVSVDFQRADAGSGIWTTIATDTTAPFSTPLDTTTLADGLYDFRVVATDGIGNTGTSAVVANRRVDNTPPSGSLTAPAAGATVGGTAVPLHASTSDSGSGVASVRYEMRPTGGGSFTTITTSTTAPFDGTWNTTGLSTGDYDLRPFVTDRAGNTFTGATVTVHVDATAPTVVLASPGASLSGTVTLNATVTGNGATQVAFLASPAGANSWTQIGVDATSPWSVAFDTTKLGDGVYDLRAVVTDSVGNTSQDTRTNIRIDNTAPVLVSSTPADGSTVSSASSIELVTNEPATPSNVVLDGAGTIAPVISGTHILYNTGPLATGLHTLTGGLSDPTGKSSSFRVSFTVFTPSSGGTPPPVEGGTSADSSTSVTSADGFATVTMPAGAWSPKGNDWIVIRIETTRSPSLANGYAPGSEVVNVTAFWALTGEPVHHFLKPIEILLRTSGKGLVPATYENGAWRGLRRMPSDMLPEGWQDGFTASNTSFLLRALHLTEFAVLRDVQAPSAPTNVLGFLIGGHLTLTWAPGADNSGTYDYMRVYSNGVGLGDFGVDRTSGDVGSWTTGDSRTFTLTETDVAGNTSPTTPALKHVPTLVGKTLDAAQSALEAAGLELGRVTQDGVGRPGTVTGPTNLVLAAPGSAIDVTVAPGTTGFSKLVFRVVSAKKLRATKRLLPARVLVTRRARVSAVLYSPQRLKLSTWRFAVKAGRTIVKLRFPSQVRRPGVYSIRWTAASGHDVVTRTATVRIFTGNRRTGPVQVVIAGSAVSPKLTLGVESTKIVKTTGADSAFDAAGAGSNGLQVMVVDVDQFGVGFVRDLHTVFPSLRMVVLSRDPKVLAKASKAGATIALPRSIPNSVLAAVVSRLLKKR